MTRPTGSEPDFQSSLPTLNEIACVLLIPVDELRPKLLNQGIYAAPHDRFPLEVVIEALEGEGYTLSQLAPVRRR